MANVSRYAYYKGDKGNHFIPSIQVSLDIPNTIRCSNLLNQNIPFYYHCSNDFLIDKQPCLKCIIDINKVILKYCCFENYFIYVQWDKMLNK